MKLCLGSYILTFGRRPAPPPPEYTDLFFEIAESGFYGLQPATTDADVVITKTGLYRVVKYAPIVKESDERLIV